MAKALIINSTHEACRIILLEHGKIVEYYIEDKNKDYTVGDIYLGSVKKVMPSLNAVFVDIRGKDKDEKGSFLHYSDLGPSFKSQQVFINKVLNQHGTIPNVSTLKFAPVIDKDGHIKDVLKRGQKILVQISKEPMATKGVRLTSSISIPDRNLILVPFSNEINISRKITNRRERLRLHNMIASIKPRNFGVIVRTVAQGKSEPVLNADLQNSLKKWNKGILKLRNATPGQKIIGELNLVTSILRDILNEDFNQIIVDDKLFFEEIKRYIQGIAPEKEKIVQLYTRKTNLFEHLGLEKQIKNLFGKIVAIDGGGYLVVEHTEAMHVIDVNSGNFIQDDQEAMALHVNKAATKEIARRLRLQNIGGIIVVDLIGMRKNAHKRQVYEDMKMHLKADRARTNVLSLTPLSLMQITRERVRPFNDINTNELCPSCNGTGKIEAAITLADHIEQQVALLGAQQKLNDITIVLHPYLYAFFTKGRIFCSRRWKWYWRYKRWITLVSDDTLPITSYQFLNKQKKLIAANPKLAYRKERYS